MIPLGQYPLPSHVVAHVSDPHRLVFVDVMPDMLGADGKLEEKLR